MNYCLENPGGRQGTQVGHDFSPIISHCSGVLAKKTDTKKLLQMSIDSACYWSIVRGMWYTTGGGNCIRKLSPAG